MGQRKTVVVTGAGGHLGQVMAGRFLARGDRVVRMDRDGTHGFGADLTDEAAAREVFGRVVQANGIPDAVVHTVGIWAQWPLLETRLEDFERVMRTNLNSAFLCFREAVRCMKDRGGTLIGIGAKPGFGNAGPMGAAYAASKAGLMRLVEATAAEHPTVRCYALAPSYILYGPQPAGTRGVGADELADLAIALIREGDVPSGTTIKAFGSLT